MGLGNSGGGAHEPRGAGDAALEKREGWEPLFLSVLHGLGFHLRKQSSDF